LGKENPKEAAANAQMGIAFIKKRGLILRAKFWAKAKNPCFPLKIHLASVENGLPWGKSASKGVFFARFPATRKCCLSPYRLFVKCDHSAAWFEWLLGT